MSHLDDKLAAFIDGELGHEARERVLTHLGECPECRAEADDQRRIKQLLGRTPAPAPSSDLMARLLAMGEPGSGPGPGQGPPPLDERGDRSDRGDRGDRDDRFMFPAFPATREGRAFGASRLRPRGAPPGGRPGNMPERALRPPVNRRKLTFAAAGAFSMMAVALSSAFVPGTPNDGTDGRPAGPAIERYLVEQAATTAPIPTAGLPRTPEPVLLAVGRARAVAAEPTPVAR